MAVVLINQILSIDQLQEYMALNHILFGRELPPPQIGEDVFPVRQDAGVGPFVIKEHQSTGGISFHKQLYPGDPGMIGWYAKQGGALGD